MSSILYSLNNSRANSSLTTGSSSNASDSPIFELELSDASVINKILSEVNDPDDNSILIVTDDGLRLVATGNRTSQVSAFFSKTIFSKFDFSPRVEQVKFRFVLKEFFETLHLLQKEDTKGAQEDIHADPVKVSLKMSYRKKGDPLKLRLENNSTYTIECDLREFSLPAIHSLMSFAGYEEITYITFNSSQLYKFVSGILDLSSQFIKLILEPGPVPIKFETLTPRLAITSKLEIPVGDTNEIIKENLNAPSNLSFNFNYRTHFLKSALDALKTSVYMKLQCGSTGLLLMEHFHDQGPRVQSVEYFILCEATNNDF